MKREKKFSGGFTLVELLSMITVLSLLVSVVIFVVISVINNSKEKGYLITKNNVTDVASSYVIENSQFLGWLNDTENKCYGRVGCQYQCVTVQNLIEKGYFDVGILKSEVAHDEYLKKEDMVYIERDNITKTITHKIFNSPICSELVSYDKNGYINFSVEPLGWSKEKTIMIEYVLNDDAGILSSRYSYLYTGSDNTLSNDLKFNSKIEEVTIKVSSNGNLVAKINDDVEKTLSINQIDNVSPTGSFVSEHRLENNQIVTITMSDNESGVKAFYFGKTDPSKEEVQYEVVESNKRIQLTKEVTSAGTWYLRVMDLAGNYSDVSEVTFYETLLSISNATVDPYRIIDVNGSQLTLPAVSSGIVLSSGYSFYGWYDNALYTGNTKTKYTVDGNKTLYGKVKQNYTGGKSNGYINLSSTGSDMLYGSKDSLTFTIDSSHGGSLSVTDNNGMVKSSVSGKTVTLTNLSNTSVGVVTVTVECGATTSYTSASTTYILTINKAINPTVIAGRALTYSGNSQMLVNISNVTGTVYYSMDNTLTSSNYANGSMSIPTKTNAGIYKIYYYVDGGDNYESLSGSVITKVNKDTNPTVISGKILTYNGNSQLLVDKSDVRGTVYYSVDNTLTSNNYVIGSMSIPTKTNAGIYKIYYYVDGGDNYKSFSGNVETTINKRDNQINIVGLELPYSGVSQKIVNVSNANGVVFYSTKDRLTSSNYSGLGSVGVPTKKDAGTWTVYYYVVGDNNHNAKSGSVTAKIKSGTCSSGYTLISNKCCPSGYNKVSGNYCVKAGYKLEGNNCVHDGLVRTWSKMSLYDAKTSCRTSAGENYVYIEHVLKREEFRGDWCYHFYGNLTTCYEYSLVCKSSVISDCTVLAKTPTYN